MISIIVFRRRVAGEPKLGIKVDKVEEPKCEECKPQIITIEDPEKEVETEPERKDPLCLTCRHSHVALTGEISCRISKTIIHGGYHPCDLYEKAKGCMDCACRISEPMKLADGKTYILCKRWRGNPEYEDKGGLMGFITKDWEELRTACEYFRDESGDADGYAPSKPKEEPAKPKETKKLDRKGKGKDKSDDAVSGEGTAGKA